MLGIKCNGLRPQVAGPPVPKRVMEGERMGNRPVDVTHTVSFIGGDKKIREGKKKR